jgi:hypothetical protein
MLPSSRSLLIAAALAVALPAPAADVPCERELASFCSTVKPGDGRIISCLRSRWGDLSATCRQALDRVASRVELFTLQCEEDLFRFCRSVPNSIDATLACLGEHASELDETCKPAFLKVKARPERIRASCAKEVPLHCSAVDASDAAGLAACLAAKSRELSPACAAAVAP